MAFVVVSNGLNPGAMRPDTAVFLTLSPLFGLDRVFGLLVPRFPGARHRPRSEDNDLLTDFHSVFGTVPGISRISVVDQIMCRNTVALHDDRNRTCVRGDRRQRAYFLPDVALGVHTHTEEKTVIGPRHN